MQLHATARIFLLFTIRNAVGQDNKNKNIIKKLVLRRKFIFCITFSLLKLENHPLYLLRHFLTH